ncbi:MAG: penicillin-binding protein 1C [Chitinophagales bacterium]|nr:penicillin-binding protein 1C [Chitinophagales bacterium]
MLFKKYLLRIGVLGVVLAIAFLLLHFLFPLNYTPTYSTLVYDSQGKIIHAFLSPDDKWRFKTERHEISPELKKVFLNKEDKWFYYHPGINPFSIVRAISNNIFKGKRTSGASTITMQVARMLEPKERTYISKLVEVFRALQLELKFTKDELFEIYINKVPYGGNIEGVKAAALIFFNKHPAYLSVGELTTLSVVPNRPSSLRLGKNNSAVEAVRNQWLRKFEEEGVFLSSEISDALQEHVNAQRRLLPRFAPHFSYRIKSLGGNIFTTIDLEKQRKCEQIVQTYVNGLRSRGIQNAAVMVIENGSGNVISYVGSADFYHAADAGQVDGAKAVRQPGSTLKPLLYGLCFDAGIYTPKTMVADVPCNFDGYVPENYDSKFRGEVTVEYALENSLNIPAVKALEALGKENMLTALKRCGFSSVSKHEKRLGLSLILGGCGVTLEEMSNLYRCIANKGIYSPIHYLKGVKKAATGDTILSATASFMLCEILSKVARPDLPVNWEGSKTLPRIAWKTGTSYGRKDAWSIGFNKNYTIGVWVGNFSNVGVPDLNGAAIATPLLFQLFNTIDYNSPNEWYAMPRECGVRTVCSHSGLEPNSFCRNLVSDYFIPLVSSNKRCEHLKEIATDAKMQISYCAECLPTAGYKRLLFENYSPEIIRWFDENHVNIKRIPPHNPLCSRIFKGNEPTIISPVNGSEYYIEKGQPPSIQLSCETAGDVEYVFWWVNNKLVSKVKAGEKYFCLLPEGDVKISCTDDKGRNTDCRVKVRQVDW